MELAVLWVVLIAVGAFVLGLVGGWIVARRARPGSSAPSPTMATPKSGTAGEAAAEAEVIGHRLADDGAPGAGDTSAGEPASAAADLTAAARIERDERARYAEIIGIETENASLRAVAARVPGLERRVRELEATLEEHTGHTEPVIDLTGPDPVVRPEGADVTSR